MTDRTDPLDRDNDPATPDAGLTGPGEYTPAGEAQGQAAGFTADDIADVFDVAVHRVHDAFQGELGLGENARVDARQAQVLAEVLLGDQPQDRRQAALMELGAFTPRTDHDRGSGETAPGEESDRLVRRGLENGEKCG